MTFSGTLPMTRRCFFATAGRSAGVWNRIGPAIRFQTPAGHAASGSPVVRCRRPSATGDIGGVIIHGAQGARSLTVLLVAPAAEGGNG